MTPGQPVKGHLLSRIAILVCTMALSVASPAVAQTGVIAFSRDCDIWVVNAAGGSPSNLTNTAADDACEERPAISPNGAEIAYNRDEGIWVMSSDGSNQRSIAWGSSPAWSPAGTTIAFANNSSIYAIDSGIPVSKRLTTPPPEPFAFDHSPTYSPSGRIAFARSASRSSIYVMNGDGSGQRELFNVSQETTGIFRVYLGDKMDWSPNGETLAFVVGAAAVSGFSKIAYISRTGETFGIMSFSQSDETGTRDRGPSWAPPNWIAFRTNRAGGGTALVNLDDIPIYGPPSPLPIDGDQPSWGSRATGSLFVGGVVASATAGRLKGPYPAFEADLPTTGKPAGIAFPFGLMNWSVDGLTLGQQVMLTLRYRRNIPAGSQYWKFDGPSESWANATSLAGSNDGDNVVTLTITDGGFGDGDGAVNGEIYDPGGFAVFDGPPADETSPVISVSLSPQPNAAGWNSADVTMSVSAEDNVGGSGVQTISCTAVGAQALANATVTGASRSLVISAEGVTTFTCSARDVQGNVSLPVAVSARLDKTPPTLHFGAQSPIANQAGWNNTDVSVPFTAGDAGSGVGSVTPPGPLLIFTGEGGALTGNVVVADLAGNAATFVSHAVKIDKTPPAVTVTQQPAPNSRGWNNTDVTVLFSVTDALSGAADGPPPVTLTQEGLGQIVTATALDRAGNSARAVLTVNIDKTPPEAYNQFDTERRAVMVFGRDALSGFSSPVALISVQVVRGLARADREDRDEEDDSEKRTGEKGPRAEERTYLVEDRAGNRLRLVERFHLHGDDTGKDDRHDEATVNMVSLQYGTRPVIVLERNEELFDWKLDRGLGLEKLSQELTVGRGQAMVAVEARFRADENQTRLLRSSPTGHRRWTRPELVLLRLATSNGRLVIEFE